MITDICCYLLMAKWLATAHTLFDTQSFFMTTLIEIGHCIMTSNNYSDCHLSPSIYFFITLPHSPILPLLLFLHDLVLHLKPDFPVTYTTIVHCGLDLLMPQVTFESSLPLLLHTYTKLLEYSHIYTKN